MTVITKIHKNLPNLELLLFVFSKQWFPDNFLRREIECKIVHCKNVAMGCDWRGELKTAEVSTNTSLVIMCSGSILSLACVTDVI